MPSRVEPSRVLHISTWGVPCGIATYAGNLVASLERMGIAGEVFPLEPHAWEHYLPADVARLRGRIVERARDCDVVHVQHEHGLFGLSKGARASARNYGRILGDLLAAGKPVVTTFHTAPLGGRPRHGIARWLERIKGFSRARTWRRRVAAPHARARGRALALVHAAHTRHALVKSGIPETAVRLMPHGCLPPRVSTIGREEAKRILGIPQGTTLLTIFGFIGRYKGHDMALKALAHLPPSYRLAICGGPHPDARDGFFESVLRQVERLGLEDRVTITGWLDPAEADRYYAATDVCLAPYREEAGLSASGAITWALSSGRPVVASKIEAFQSIQRSSPCMLMTAPGRPQEMAWAVERLRDDDRLAESLVAGAGAYCREHSWDRVAGQTLELYREACGLGGATRSGVVTEAAPRSTGAATADLAEAVRQTQQLQGWCPLEKAEALARLVVETRPECVVEIGVYGGRSAVPMALAARTYGGTVHGVDPWSHAAALEGDVGDENREWWGKLDLEGIYRGFLDGIRRFGVEDTLRVHRMTDTAALPMFADGSIGLLHVDGNHSAEVSMRYVEQWGPKIAPGGHLVMDDIDWGTQAETVAFIERTYAMVRRESSWAIYRKEAAPAAAPAPRRAA